MPRKNHLKNDEQTPAPAAAATTPPPAPADRGVQDGASFASQMLDEAGSDDGAGAEQQPPAKTPVAIASHNLSADSGTRMPLDSMAAITKELGARWWATNKRFDWAVNVFKHHYEFTRFYFEEFVLVDMWPNANNSARQEVLKKKACIDVENKARAKRKEKPLGYLPIQRGTAVPKEYFARAKAGETFALIERAAVGVAT